MAKTERVPVGYRFHPTDEELVGHYLKHKLLGDDSKVRNIIAEVDVCRIEPWDLPAFSKVESEDPEWIFFCPRGLKYTNSNRSNRKTKAGYWKATGKDRNIKTRGTNNVIGTKKTLVFYKGRVPRGVKTNWVIHEYHAATFPADKRSFVLCRLMKKADTKAEGGTAALIHDEGEPRSDIAADSENHISMDGIPDVSGSILIHDEGEPRSDVAADSENQITMDGIPDVNGSILIHDEGEPRSDIAAGSENQITMDGIPDVNSLPEVNPESIFLAPSQANEPDLPSLRLSPVNQQEPYFQDSIFPNSYFWNENSIMQFPFETTENEDNSIMQFPFETTENEDNIDLLLNSFIADEDVFISEERRHAFINDSTPSRSLGRVCHESLETDAELLSARGIPGNVTKVKILDDAVHTGHLPLSSKNEVNQEKNNGIFDDDLWGGDASGDSSANNHPFSLLRGLPLHLRGLAFRQLKKDAKLDMIRDHTTVCHGELLQEDLNPRARFQVKQYPGKRHRRKHTYWSQTKIREKLRKPVQNRI